MKKVWVLSLMAVFAGLCMAQGGLAADFKIGIMQDKPGVARKYKPLINYFESKGVQVTLKGYRNYPDAAIKFERGDVDAMFAGSGVAGSMMIKGIAYPLARPVHEEGWSTYWAVVLAPKGSPKSTDQISYFNGKRITCSSLASSGEFFARSILGTKTELIRAGSHGIAIATLDRGQADVAIVKNRVWDTEKAKYPDLEEVGKDNGENPDGTLIISNKTDTQLVAGVNKILLGLADDNSAEALAVKKGMKITSYIPTTEEDFSHTLELLSKAGVTKDFNFSY